MTEYEEGLYIRNLMKDQRNMVQLTGGLLNAESPNGITGFVDSDHILSATASYGNEIAGVDTLKKFNSTVEKAKNSIPGLDSVQIAPQKMTRVTWQSSSLNSLSFDIYKPSYAPGLNNLKDGDAMWRAILPTTFGAGGIISVPNGYSVNMAGEQTNLISVYVGDWFKSINSWVMTSGNLTVSKTKIEGTKDVPLFVKLSVVLQPAREFHADDVISWYVRGYG